MAPMPQMVAITPAQNPMNGTLVTMRTATTPTTTRRKNGQNSSACPMIHCPTMPPTTISAANNITNHSISEDNPTRSPTIVTQAKMDAKSTPKNASTPEPNDAPKWPPDSTVSFANFGITP